MSLSFVNKKTGVYDFKQLKKIALESHGHTCVYFIIPPGKVINIATAFMKSIKQRVVIKQ